MFSSVTSRMCRERRAERGLTRRHGPAYADGFETDAEILGEDAGIVAGVLRGNRRRLGNADEIFRPEGRWRMTATTAESMPPKRDERALETALCAVVAQSPARARKKLSAISGWSNAGWR